jgi:hypothetical protein
MPSVAATVETGRLIAADVRDIWWWLVDDARQWTTVPLA